jgi:hypothetical protein
VSLRLNCVLALTILSVACTHDRQDLGKTKFETYCAGCHLNEGPWMMGEAPPLEGSSWVAGPETRIIKIALHGLRGPIEVHGKSYNQEMPGFAPILTDADLAPLLSYVRKRFGGASKPVSESAVSRIRAANPARMELWTVNELSKNLEATCAPGQTHFPPPRLCRCGNGLRSTLSQLPVRPSHPSR